MLENSTPLRYWENMRITRECFDAILLEIGDQLDSRIYQARTGGREKLDNAKVLTIGIWYLINENTYREIANDFGVTRSTAHKAVRWVVDVLNDLKPKVIYWPSEEELLLEDEYFAQLSNIKGTIGCIDGCHIKIRSPSKSLQACYLDRTRTHSVNLMAVCDSKKKVDIHFCGRSWKCT